MNPLKEVNELVGETQDKFDKRKKLYNEFTVKRILSKFNIIDEDDIYLTNSIRDLIDKKKPNFDKNKLSEVYNVLYKNGDTSAENILNEFEKYNTRVINELEDKNQDLYLDIRQLEDSHRDISEEKEQFEKIFKEEREHVKSLTNLLHSLQNEKNELKKDIQNLNMRLQLRK